MPPTDGVHRPREPRRVPTRSRRSGSTSPSPALCLLWGRDGTGARPRRPASGERESCGRADRGPRRARGEPELGPPPRGPSFAPRPCRPGGARWDQRARSGEGSRPAEWSRLNLRRHSPVGAAGQRRWRRPGRVVPEAEADPKAVGRRVRDLGWESSSSGLPRVEVTRPRLWGRDRKNDCARAVTPRPLGTSGSVTLAPPSPPQEDSPRLDFPGRGDPTSSRSKVGPAPSQDPEFPAPDPSFIQEFPTERPVFEVVVDLCKIFTFKNPGIWMI